MRMNWSPLSQGRELKYSILCACETAAVVAPLAGARIEIRMPGIMRNGNRVAPLAGARIEISKTGIAASDIEVAPLAGARIEINC